MQGLQGEAGAKPHLSRRQGHAQVRGGGGRTQQGPDDRGGIRGKLMQRAQEEQPADSPVVASSRTVDIAVSLLLLALAGLLAFDNWRTGMSWDSTGPQAGYFPFYLSLILATSSVYGIVKELAARESEPFVRREQLRRVLQVFAPTLAFCLLMQWLWLYLASFLLVAGFMISVGRIAVWKSLVTALC